MTVEISNGVHDPPHAFFVVNGSGMLVDLSAVQGQLWDPNTVAKIQWGHKAKDGRTYGLVFLKSGGNPRPVWDANLMTPYLNAYYAEREKRGLGGAAAFTTRPRPVQAQ